MWNDDIIKIEISSYKVILIALLIYVFVKAGHLIISILILAFIAFILAALIQQLGESLHKRFNKLSQKTWNIIIYILFLFLLWTFTINLLSQLITQTIALASQLTANIPNYSLIASKIKAVFPFINTATITATISNMASSLINFQTPLAGAKWLANLFPSIILVFFTTWYFVIDMTNILHSILKVFHNQQHHDFIIALFQDVKANLGRWAKAQLILMLIIGIMSYIALIILGIPYALVLATISGALEIIPNFGPIIALIPAVITGYITHGPVKALLVAIAYLLIQQSENTFIVPYIMGNLTKTHPLVIILLITLGQSLIGPIGAILSIPLYMTVISVINSYKNLKNNE